MWQDLRDKQGPLPQGEGSQGHGKCQKKKAATFVAAFFE